MGCDIHLYVEKKIDGVWQPIKGVNEPEIEGFKKYLERDKTEANRIAYWENRIKEEEEGSYSFIYDGRNYSLFSILADVRNGYGFAGVDTGEGYVPIDMPRGLPEDVSDFVKAESDGWDCDGHSHSYLTARDLSQYNWNQVTVKRGIVGEDEYISFKENGRPQSWCGGIAGMGIIDLENREMDIFINNPNLKDDSKQYYTKVEWMEPYTTSVGYFYTWSLPKMVELAEEDLDSVRIVFWFDN